MGDKDKAPKSRIGTSIFSRILFSFISPTISKAKRKGRLQEDEVPEHTMDLDTSHLFKRFDDEWQQQQKRESPSMVQALVAGRWYLIVATGVGYIIAQASTLAGPLLLKQIVAGLTCRQNDDRSSCDSERTLYMYALGLFIAPLIQALVENNNLYQLDQLGLSFRNALMGAIYRKCLRLNNSALASESTGKIVTLMSNDSQKLQEVVLSIHSIWGAPIYILAIMALLYREIEWASLVGLGVLLVLVPISGFIGRGLGKQRRAIVKFIDRRTSFMSEIINGIRVIKFYNWERPFKDQVLEVRNEEASILRKIAVFQAMFGLTLFTGPVLVGIASFSAYAGGIADLTATKAYTSLALFTLLRFPMAFLPTIIFNVVNARVAMRRISDFLARDEVRVSDTGYQTDGVPPGEVAIADGQFTWDDDDTEPTLRGVNLTCAPGTLTMIVGAVGCGKSSLLATVFRQISRVKGSVRVGGKLAYVPQSAWIMNETLRENVLLGLPMDEERYQAALTAAQLAADLEQLHDGDLTEIGERGVTLSGGQKQRVSIARAVYSDADVVILDDPLSAVDSHVGRALFQDCICGALRGKTVLLVTNALHFLHAADQVVWVRDGTLAKVGTYDDMRADGNFMEIIGSHVVAEDVDTDSTAKAGEPASTADSGSSGTGSGIKADPPPEGKADGAVMNAAAVAKGGLTGQEERQVGALSGSVMWRYIAGTGGVLWLVVLMFLYIGEQGSKIVTDRWPGLWTQDRFDRGLGDLGFYLSIYAALALLFGFITLLRSLHFTFGAVRAAVSLHNALLDRVLRLPPTFFDTNPSGRILNRFSRDTEIMDAVLPTSLIQVGACVTSYFGILIVISVATPWFVLMLPPVTVVYYFIQRYYIPSARELQRLESVTRSPIYSGFSESVNGITTIRSYAREAHFTRMEDRRIACNGLMYLTQRAAAQWLSVRLDCMGLTVLTAAGLLAVASDVSPSLAGLSLTYALDLTKFLKFGTRIASKTETDFNSVERIVEYLDEREEAPEFREGKDPDLAEWPTKGTIDVNKIIMRYRPSLPTVLKQVSFSVAGGEHVGIVGRTGSGKSSLFLVFFRMVEPESGSVTIDGVDITSIGLAPLRRSLSMIPQDPFMFSGTVRRNLDPFDNCSDVEVWQALESVSLKGVIQGLESQLEAKVSDNGGNFSQGQRQLFCLARALLRKSKILMMDEATASVDVDTDQLIQKVIREKFGHCTVLTIAHRLNTIMDSDKVLVMDNGDAAEFDTPVKLLQDDRSLFTGLVNKTGQNAARKLKDMANASHGRLRELDPDSTPRNALPSEIAVNANQLYSPEQTFIDAAHSESSDTDAEDDPATRTHSQLLPPPIDMEALQQAQVVQAQATPARPPRPPSGEQFGEAVRLSMGSAGGRRSSVGGRRSTGGIMDPDGPLVRPRVSGSGDIRGSPVPRLNISRRSSAGGREEPHSGRPSSLSARGSFSARSNGSAAVLAADSVLAHAAVGIGAGALPLDSTGDAAYPWLVPDSMGYGPDDFQTAFSSGFYDGGESGANTARGQNSARGRNSARGQHSARGT